MLALNLFDCAIRTNELFNNTIKCFRRVNSDTTWQREKQKEKIRPKGETEKKLSPDGQGPRKDG